MSDAVFPFLLESPSGLRVQVNANGSLRRIDHGDILLNSFLGNEVEGGPANLYLRLHGTAIESVPLLGPASPSAVTVSEEGLVLTGVWKDVAYSLSLRLAQSAPSWIWQGTVRNTGMTPVKLDVIYAQDLSLAHYGAVRMNEYYVSQYVDYTPLVHPRQGRVLAVRQNLLMGGANPWAIVASLREAVAFATDAMQLHGLATRAGAALASLERAALPSQRLQHEHSMAVLQDSCQELEADASTVFGFLGWFEANHPDASSAADLSVVDRALELPELNTPVAATVGTTARFSATLFSHCPALQSLDLDDAEAAKLFGKDWRNVERDDGATLSFFVGPDRHVVMKAKELQTLRPHGHLIRSGDHLVPDEASLTSTTWMSGVFHSLVTQGHVNINRFLSTVRSYLGLQRSSGVRVFVELADSFHRLEVPSAYEMSPNGCRWIYKHASGILDVRAWAPIDRHELNLSLDVMGGAACRFLISHHVALNGDDGAESLPAAITVDARGVAVRATVESDVSRRFPEGYFRIDAAAGTEVEHAGGDEALFLDGQSRGQAFVCLRTKATLSASLSLTGHLIANDGETVSTPEPPSRANDERAAADFYQRMSGSVALRSGSAGDECARVQEILPWLAHNALIHYLAPRGLEQFSGGGWGTRDVCQGPVEMLLALGEWQPLHDLLLRVFRQQNPDGDWPQWFMFFERERNIRPDDAHGDIVFWPLLALAQYLIAAEDASILDTFVPYFHPDGDDAAETATIWEHAERALQLIDKRVIPNTQLAAYGHGDWNDSLQPADPAMCESLCSAWTVTLCFQMMTTLAAALCQHGREEAAGSLEARASSVRAQFQEHLIVDGTIAGYADFRNPAQVNYLLHPSDQTTGIRFSLLPMIHAIINGMLSAEQAGAHVAHISQHLLGADGARLFDRPFDYRGGPQRHFQRAETSTFFGREVGIMYMHAHLRYAEAMAHLGNAEAFFLALRQANPIGLRQVVPAARLRQANCYYSSSDATFADRYEALADYEKVKSGAVAFEGGWRVYSSGAGIALRLLHECLLGIRRRKSKIVVDPVLPQALDGLSARVELCGKQVDVEYRVGRVGCGPQTLVLNGKPLPFVRVPNPYRTGGAELSVAALGDLLVEGHNSLRIELE